MADVLEPAAAYRDLSGAILHRPEGDHRALQAAQARLIRAAESVSPHDLGLLLLERAAAERRRGEQADPNQPHRSIAVDIAFWAAARRDAHLDDDDVRELLGHLGSASYGRVHDAARIAEDLAIASRAQQDAPSAATLDEIRQLCDLLPLHGLHATSEFASLLLLSHRDETIRATIAAQSLPGLYRLALDGIATLDDTILDGLGRQALAAPTFRWRPDLEDEAAFDAAILDDLHDLLAHDAAYLALADRLLAAAEERLDELHGNPSSFSADTHFDDLEVAELARAAGAMLEADVAGAGERVTAILERAAIAPTAAKAAPSQRLVNGLTAEIERVPTPEAIAGLRGALGRIRHASLVKRGTRRLRAAEKALPRRGDLALRVAGDEAPTAAALRSFTGALEAQLALRTSWTVAEWERLLFGTPKTAKIAGALVWFVERADRSTTTFLGGPTGATNVEGRPVELGDDIASITVWHPLLSDEAGRAAWRERIWERRVNQPFRQVFREYYLPRDPEEARLDEYGGVTVGAKQLLGVALAEGWRLRRGDALERRFGDVTASLDLAHGVYPSADFPVGTTGVRLRLGGVDVPPRDLPPVVVSEALRAVDLLLSVSSIELADPFGREGLHGTATPFDEVAVRRIVAEHLYVAEPRVRVERRRIHVGDTEIHLATGRVMRHGEPVELDAPTVRRTFVPAKERLLTLVLDRVDALLATGS